MVITGQGALTAEAMNCVRPTANVCGTRARGSYPLIKFCELYRVPITPDMLSLVCNDQWKCFSCFQCSAWSPRHIFVLYFRSASCMTDGIIFQLFRTQSLSSMMRVQRSSQLVHLPLTSTVHAQSYGTVSIYME